MVKDRFCQCSNDDRLEFVTRHGHTFLTTVQDRENRIFGLRKWEQAFRVYAAIYSKANPTRSAEIWQYLHIINTAASSYAWENVAYYDFTFRQMMSHNPNWSWAKLYNQLWNLAMCNPLQKQQSGGFGFQGNTNHSHRSSFASSSGGKGSRKSNRPCWKFNKNQPCDASFCDYDHKCSYCGMYGHSVLDCTKLFAKKNESGPKPGNNNNRNGSKSGNGNGSGQNNQNHSAGALRVT